MTTLCLTGGSPARLEAAAGILHRAGMARPAPLAGEAGIDFAHWHQHACEALGQAEEVTPGRLWERLAADLFLANADTPLWGWAEARSVALLEFWAGFEASIRFVLLCETPRQALGNILRQNAATEPVEAALLQWQETHEALLRFHLRHPRRSLLVWAEDAERAPCELLQTINSRWSLQLADETATPAVTPPTPLLETYLADRIAEHSPQVEILARELQASIGMLTEDSPADSMVIDGDALIEGYRRLRDRSGEEQRIAVAQDQREAEAKARAEAETQAAARLKQAAEENELLLLQLHQVQEELENYFLKHQEIEEKNTALGKQMDALGQARDAEAKGKADAQARIGALEKEKGELSAARDQQAKLAQERQAQIEQLTQAKAALEQEKSALAGRQGELERQVADLTQARDAEAKGKAEATAQREAEAKARAEAETQAAARLKQAAEENELLLLQLHQVQEELENYFLKHQAQQARLERLFNSTLGLYDCETVEYTQPDSDNPDRRRWRIRNLQLGARVIDSLEFDTHTDDEVTGFTFRRERNNSGPLQRWPASARQNTEITLIPVKDAKSASGQSALLLLQLSSNDWDLLRILPVLLTTAIQNGRVAVPEALQRQALLNNLARSRNQMAALQQLVRFDTVAWGQDKPDAEGLSLRLGGMSCGDKRIPAFEFRIKTRQAEEGKLTHVALIFAESTAGAPFATWQANCDDDHGKPVMVLVIDAGGPEAAAWNALPPADRAFVIALTDAFPIALVTLQATGARLTGEWKRWLDCSGDLRRWIRERPAALPPFVITTEQPVARKRGRPRKQ